jgi:hypothetical protein
MESMAWTRRLVSSLLLVACKPEDPPAMSGGTEGGSDGTGVASTGELETSSSGADEPPGWELPPACDELELPGDPADVAATPRADRDAEILALQLAPELLVARQDRYDVIEADLAAIRALEPAVEDVHVECVVPYGHAFWPDDRLVVDAVTLRSYRAWDCHNAFYGIEHRAVGEGGDVWRIDGLGFAMGVSGVFHPSFIDAYRTLPGVGDGSIASFWQPGDGFAYECEPTGSITLDASFDPSGDLDERTYTFEHPEQGTVVYLVAPGAPPVPLG